MISLFLGSRLLPGFGLLLLFLILFGLLTDNMIWHFTLHEFVVVLHVP